MLTRKAGFGLASLLAMGLAAHTAQAATGDIYNQAYLGTYGTASQNDASHYGNFATAYDDFTLGANGTVTGAHWAGVYFVPSGQTFTSGTITGFTLTFYGDNAGTPGTALSTQTVTGNANQTVIDATSRTYNYSTTFSTPFAAQAGTKYWLSIVPTMNYLPQWGWENGTGGNGASYQSFNGTRSVVGNDQAFGLTGSASVPNALPTPEPSSVAAFAFTAMGAAGLVLKARKRQPSA